MSTAAAAATADAAAAAAAADSAAADAASAAAAADQYEDCHIVIADSSIVIKVRRNSRLWQRERQGLSRVWWPPPRIADGEGGINNAGGGDHALLATEEFASCGISGISGVGDNDAAAAASADACADADAAASERRGDAIAARN